MAGWGQFQIVDTVCDCVCVMYVQMIAVSFVTLVCSPSMSVIIADLAKRPIKKLKWLTAYLSSGCLQTFTSEWRLVHIKQVFCKLCSR